MKLQPDGNWYSPDALVVPERENVKGDHVKTFPMSCRTCSLPGSVHIPIEIAWLDVSRDIQ